MHIEQDGILMPNPYVVSLDQHELKTKTYYRRGSALPQHQRISRPREGHRRVYVPRREEVVEVLAQEGMLPAIYFVFSRSGCDKSVRWLRDAGVRLTTREEAATIRDRAEARAAWVDEDDLVSLGFYEFLESLTTGVAAHHAGMLPLFKETVEELFQEGLVKVVFATETLSLGINMPAKSVVIEDLWKFQGERHELVTPGEYTQLTGRAGRRGIDALGHAVVVYQRQVPFERVAGLAATRTYDLASSFRPSYNMAVNLVRNYTPEQAHQLLNSSFAQFLADRGVVVLERSRQQDLATLEGYRKNLVCHLGDFEEYWGYLEKARRLRDEDRRRRDQGRRDDVRASVAGLRPGEVVWVPRARRRGLAVVVSSRDGKPTVLAQDRPVLPAERPGLRGSAAGRSRGSPCRGRGAPQPAVPSRRRGPARRARRQDRRRGSDARRPSPKVEREAARLEALAAAHPCRRCPERAKHERWAVRASELQRRSAAWSAGSGSAPRRSLGSSTGSCRCCGRWDTSTSGRSRRRDGRSTRIYGEGDLLVGEALASGLFDDLRPSEVVALLSAVIYEGRERMPLSGRDAHRRDARSGTSASSASGGRSGARRTSIRCSSAASSRQASPRPIYHWAEGEALDDILAETEMAPGDFIRNCKQLVDLLRQIEDVADARRRQHRSGPARCDPARRRRLHGRLATMPPVGPRP